MENVNAENGTNGLDLNSIPIPNSEASANEGDVEMRETPEGEEGNGTVEGGESGEALLTLADRPQLKRYAKSRLDITGLPKEEGIAELFKEVVENTLRMDSFKFIVIGDGTTVRLAFASRSKRKYALKTLDGFLWKGCQLKATVVHHLAYSQEELKTWGDEEPLKVESEEPKTGPGVYVVDEEDMIKRHTPMHGIPYEDQLEMKRDVLEEGFCVVTRTVEQANPAMREWIDKQKRRLGGLPCKVDTILPSPVVDGYRRRLSVAIGYDDSTKEWRVSIDDTFRPGVVKANYSVDALKHVPQSIKEALKTFTQILNEHQKPEEGTVCMVSWRVIAVTSSLNDAVMIAATLNDEESLEKICLIKEKIKEYLERGESNIVSFTFSGMVKNTQIGLLPELVFGNEYLEDQVKGCTLHFGVEMSFPSNLKCMEVLIDAILAVTPMDEETALINITCEFTCMSVILAKFVGEVHTFNVEDIDEAKMNAEANGLTNCHFYEEKSIEFIQGILENITKPNIIFIATQKTIANKDVYRLLRKSEKAKKFILVTSNAQVTSKDLTDLYCPPRNDLPGDAYAPAKAIPVDIFPHKSRVELVVLLERKEGLDYAAVRSRGRGGGRGGRGGKGGRFSQRGGGGGGFSRGKRMRRNEEWNNRGRGAKRQRFDGRRRYGGYPRSAMGGYLPDAAQQLLPELLNLLVGQGPPQRLRQQNRVAFAAEALRKFDEEMVGQPDDSGEGLLPLPTSRQPRRGGANQGPSMFYEEEDASYDNGGNFQSNSYWSRDGGDLMDSGRKRIRPNMQHNQQMGGSGFPPSQNFRQQHFDDYSGSGNYGSFNSSYSSGNGSGNYGHQEGPEVRLWQRGGSGGYSGYGRGSGGYN